MRNRTLPRWGGALLVPLATLGAASFSQAATDGPRRPVVRVVPLAAAAVRTVAVTAPGQAIELNRLDDGSWAEASGAMPESAALMLTMEDRLFPLLAYRSLVTSTPSPEFGLAEPALSLRVTDVRGVETEVQVGAESFTGGGFYARATNDDRRVHLIPRRMVDDLRSLLAGQRIDAPNEIATKVRELEERAERPRPSWWLQQVLGDEELSPGW